MVEIPWVEYAYYAADDLGLRYLLRDVTLNT